MHASLPRPIDRLVRSAAMAVGVFSVALFGGLAVGCGRPAPEKVCDHVVEIGTAYLRGVGASVSDDDVKKHRDRCVADAEKLRAANKPKYECQAKCSLKAKSLRDVEECEKSCA